jgi:hypothetical protein
MVGLILLFIFLTPRSWFRDQPRTVQASQISLVRGGHGSDVLWIEPELLAGVPENQRLARVSELLKSRPGKIPVVTRVEPILDSEGEVKGYMAIAKP